MVILIQEIRMLFIGESGPLNDSTTYFYKSDSSQWSSYSELNGFPQYISTNTQFNHIWGFFV